MHTTTTTVLQMIIARLNVTGEAIANLRRASDSDSGGWITQLGYADALLDEQQWLHRVMRYMVDNELLPELEAGPDDETPEDAAELQALTDLAAEVVLPEPQTTSPAEPPTMSPAEPIRNQPEPPAHESPPEPRTMWQRFMSRSRFHFGLPMF